MIGPVNSGGLDLLAAKMREEMTEELGHACGIIARILFLGGKPDLTPEKIPIQVENLGEIFSADLADEKEVIRFYSEVAVKAMETGDIGTRVVFENAVLDEEGNMA